MPVLVVKIITFLKNIRVPAMIEAVVVVRRYLLRVIRKGRLLRSPRSPVPGTVRY